MGSENTDAVSDDADAGGFADYSGISGGRPSNQRGFEDDVSNQGQTITIPSAPAPVSNTLTADERASARQDRTQENQNFFGGSGQDVTDFNFANSQAANQLQEDAKGFFPDVNLPGISLINAITGLPSRMTLDALNRGQVPTFTDGNITGTTGQGFGANQTMGTIGQMNQPGVQGGLNTNPMMQTQNFFQDDGNDNNPAVLPRRRTTTEVDTVAENPISSDLAVNVLQNPYYLYSGMGNLYQPYGYAPNTLVDLLGTRNLTQPTSAAPNLNLFGNPRDFA